MTSVTDLRQGVDVVVGVDTHVQTHSAAVVRAGTGQVLDELTVEATAQGYAELAQIARRYAQVCLWAIEGTGSHGAGLTRHLEVGGQLVVEVDRPKRAKRRNGAKSDPLDAIRAAREAIARTHVGGPRSGGERQALSVLITVRRSAVKAATVAKQELFGLAIAAPEPVRQRLRGKRGATLISAVLATRTHSSWDSESISTVTALRAVARRAKALLKEADDHERAILTIVRSWRPDLLELHGVGPITAATVLCAWSHPGRIRSEAAFAMLAGVAPIPATSGQTVDRHRLNRHGDRQLNAALHTIVINRMRHDPRTRAYVERRHNESKNDRDIRRCLKRYIARDLYRRLEHPLDKP